MYRSKFGAPIVALALLVTSMALAGPGRAADPEVLAADSFSRTVPLGWGDAETGGSYRLLIDEGASVDGSRGLLFVPRGDIRTATLQTVPAGPHTAVVTFAIPEIPDTGEVSVGLTLRRDGGDYYYARVRVDQLGGAFLAIVGNLDAGSSWLLTPEVRLGSIGSDDAVTLRVASALGGSPGVVAKAWPADEPEPAPWQVSAEAADLPQAGVVGIRAVSNPVTPGVLVAIDDYQVAQLPGQNRPPVADFTATTDGLTVKLDAAPSEDPDGIVDSYRWDFGDGSSAVKKRPPLKVYEASGTYRITLTVTDDAGASTSAAQEITVTKDNEAPVPAFRVTADALSVVVDGSASIDADGRIVEYRWDYGDGTTAQGATPPQHRYAEPGEYQVSLTVVDDLGGQATTSRAVATVANQPPLADLTYTTRGLRLLATSEFSSDPDGEVVSSAWDFGDGTTATGATLPVHTYAQSGTYSVTLTVTDNRGATDQTSRQVVIAAGDLVQLAEPGAKLPVVYDLADLTGGRHFVAPNGSDELGDGTQAKPHRTLRKAVAVSAPGDTVILRGGTYPIDDNATSIGKDGLTIIAYPGEIPIFDGSVPAPEQVRTEGALRWLPYTPMPARPGEGLSLSQLPTAKFDSSGNPVGLAKERGWRCVASTGYQSGDIEDDAEIDVPYEDSVELQLDGAAAPPPGEQPVSPARPASFRMAVAATGAGSGCPAGTQPRVIAGYYPDQVWVDGRALTQVLDRSRVVPGTFYVPRTAATDRVPGPSRIYLSPQDAADPSLIRVSRSTNNFLHVPASGVTLEGFQVVRHSPAWPFFGLTVTSQVADLVVRDVVFDSISSVAVKVAGSDARDQSGLTRRVTLDRMTVHNAGWIGLSVLYADDTLVQQSAITGSNADGEFNTSPKSGGIKATKTHRMKVVDALIADNRGHGIWWDQSNYNAVLADSTVSGNSDSAVFYEISHGLTAVNNIITRGGSPSSSPTVRLAGASHVRLVNNTIVGGQTPLALASDPRSKTYGPNGRPCAEHTQRYRAGGSVGADCPPALKSDLDFARPGAFGSPNLTPRLTWRPSASMLLNNVIADPIPGSGGICPGGHPLCVKTYSGSQAKPTVAIPPADVLPADLIMDGNVYQSAGTVAQILVPSGTRGGIKTSELAQLRGGSGLGAPVYGLAVEHRGLAGDGFATPEGMATETLTGLHGQAAAVPVDAVINEYLAAGTRHYGAFREAAVPMPLPTGLPTAAFTAQVVERTVAVDASASTAEDGLKLRRYGWDFGDDSGVQFGQTLTHVYDEPGTYTVTLLVVDQKGRANITHQVVAIEDPDAPSDALAQDDFEREVAAGFGAAGVGGSWSLAGNSAKYQVDGAVGVFDLEPGRSRQALLRDVAVDDAVTSVVLGIAEPLTGGGLYSSVIPRATADGSAYRAKVQITSAGRAQLRLTKVVGGRESVLKVSPTVVEGVAVGSRLVVAVAASGTSPTELRAKMWLEDTAEPDWQVTATDASPVLQRAGGTGVFAYQSSSASAPVMLLLDDFGVVPAGTD